MRPGTATALLVAAPFALAVALAARLALDALAPVWVALVLALSGGVVFVAVRARAARGAKYGLAVATSTLVALLVVPELGLRSAGFRRISGVEFGYPSPTDFLELEPDPELFWTLPRDVVGTNSLGFAGPEPRVPKPTGSWRALFLGDSCLWQGHPQEWPALGVNALSARTSRPLESVNLSLAGYSTLQGLRVAERHGLALEPDLVVLCYGWNDHWLARGSIDADKVIHARFERVYRSSRMLQALASFAIDSGESVLDVPRVSPEQYDANLTRMVRVFRAQGIPVLLVTAPSTHDVRVPEYLLRYRFGNSASEIVADHARYAQITREVARRESVPVLDLAAELALRAERESWFLADGIHFTEAGRQVIAQRFAERVGELGLVP